MQKTVCSVVVELARQRHADRDAQALSQRAAGNLDARQLQPMRMSLERRVEFAQGDDVFDGKISGEGQAQIERRRFVSGRPDDAVALLPLGIIGIMISDLQVQSGNDFHHGQRASGVAGAGGAKRHQVVTAHQAGGLLKFIKGKIANYSFGERHCEQA